MARLARVAVANVPHHVTQRGNARQFLLASEVERRVYLDLLSHCVKLHGVSVLGYCITSNHVHLIAVPQRRETFRLSPGFPESFGLTGFGAAYFAWSASGNAAAAGAVTGHTNSANAAAEVAAVATTASGMVTLVTSNGNLQRSARWAAAEGVITARPDELFNGGAVDVVAKAIDYAQNLKRAFGF